MRMLNPTCEFGHFEPRVLARGDRGFPDLDRRAATLIVGETETRVAHLGDVIRSKQAAGRTKDLAVLPALELFAAEKGIDVSARESFLPRVEPPAPPARTARSSSAADARRRLDELNRERERSEESTDERS